VRLLPDYLWTAVEPQLRTALLATFGFARRDLGQDVWDSEVVSTIQAVPGVDYVDLEALDAVSKDRLDRLLESDVLWEQPESVPPRIAAQLAYPVSGRSIAPAELVYLTADINSTILLKEIPV